jgi:hypothetical protein
MTGLYKYIDSWDKQTLFNYVVIFILIIWLFSTSNMGVNILIGLIIASFVISYLNYKTIDNINNIDNTHHVLNVQGFKKNIIIPVLNNSMNENIVDFLYSIQDFYHYNPQQYSEVIKNINEFYILYETTILDNMICDINYNMMEQLKRDALNALSSISIAIPSHRQVIDKLDSACKMLDEIMTTSLDQISDNGYNVDTKIINYGVKAYNEYNDVFQPYSYEIY